MKNNEFNDIEREWFGKKPKIFITQKSDDLKEKTKEREDKIVETKKIYWLF